MNKMHVYFKYLHFVDTWKKERGDQITSLLKKWRAILDLQTTNTAETVMGEVGYY